MMLDPSKQATQKCRPEDRGNPRGVPTSALGHPHLKNDKNGHSKHTKLTVLCILPSPSKSLRIYVFSQNRSVCLRRFSSGLLANLICSSNVSMVLCIWSSLYTKDESASTTCQNVTNSYLRNEISLWKVHGIMNTSGLLQS